MYYALVTLLAIAVGVAVYRRTVDWLEELDNSEEVREVFE